MNPHISIIITVNDAQEADLAIPLSSINNQLGIDFREVEVILVDGGRYRLENLEAFRLFKNIRINYESPDTVLSWEESFEWGLNVAHGDYVMFMGPDGLLNQTSVVQTFNTVAGQNPDADVLTGLVLEQDMTRSRQTEYTIGTDLTTVRGRWIKRSFLDQFKIHWEPVGEYSDELYSRLINIFSRGDTAVNEIAYARFMSRDVRGEVLAPTSREMTVGWLNMMSRYLTVLQKIDQKIYEDEFARECVRYYTQQQRVLETDRKPFAAAMQAIVEQNAAAWVQAQSFIDHVKLQDTSPEAPWNADTQSFNRYLDWLNQIVSAALK